MSPLPLRADFHSQTTRSAARRSKYGPQARRLLALAAICDGATRTEAARTGGVVVQIVRDWVMKFNALGPDGIFDRKAPGQPSRLEDERRRALAAVIERGPILLFTVLSVCASSISASSCMRSSWSQSPSRL